MLRQHRTIASASLLRASVAICSGANHIRLFRSVDSVLPCRWNRKAGIRKRLFAIAGVDHIDKYIRVYKAGKIDVALPHLIIIVDEFAELKAMFPDFMSELISAARIGRSLGVHLILATQKPIPQVLLNRSSFPEKPEDFAVFWLGHASAILIKIDEVLHAEGITHVYLFFNRRRGGSVNPASS